VPKATLGGCVLIASRPVTWTVSAGVFPNTEIFDVMPEDAKKLLGKTAPVKLEIEGGITVSNLWVIGESPSSVPAVRCLIVSDRRWMWPYAYVYRRFNMRKRVGVKRLTVPGNPPQIQEIGDTVKFHAWSLREGTTPWTAKDAIQSVFDEVNALDLGGVPTVINKTDFLKSLPIENLIIDDDGDAAIERVLGCFPGLKVWVDLSGNIIIDSENNLAGVADQAAKILPEIVGGGHIVTVSNAVRRPSKVTVLFSREHELRFDFAELESSKLTVVNPVDTREVTNVLPIPDWKLSIGGVDYCQGTWISFPQAFSSWGDVTPEFGVMDYDWLMKSLLPHNGMFAIVQGWAELNTKVDWTARLSSISQHFRQTYRINPGWMSKISTLKANRIATLDPITGNRSPAIAYCDYVSFFTQRLWSDNKRMNTPRNLEYARNYKGYPSQIDGGGVVIGSAIDENSQPAPAEISVVDPDLGIIRADFIVDPLRLSDLILPGNILATAMPSCQLDRSNGKYIPITLDSVIDGCDKIHMPALDGKFKIAFVLTATPAAPNDTRQLYGVDIMPGDVATEVPNLGVCMGPAMQIRVSPTVETARFAWSDAPEDVKAIEASFGIGGAIPSMEGIKHLCVNGDDKNFAASLQSIAKAVAAQFYATLVDHQVGSASGVMNASMAPIGWIKAVIHELTMTGELVTHLAIPDKIPEMNLFRYMDAGTRALIMHEIVQNTK
jgi:hypothetical protein